jgi:hypothetical protein
MEHSDWLKKCQSSNQIFHLGHFAKIGKPKFARIPGQQDFIVLLKTTCKNRNPKFCDSQKSGKSGFPIFVSSSQTL